MVVKLYRRGGENHLVIQTPVKAFITDIYSGNVSCLYYKEVYNEV
jgi:hypothetical protein